MFHPRCGGCVVLSNGSKTATRSNPTQEFNRGLVFSFEPLKDNEIFEVRIDKKLNTWSGSIEIGVTVCNPDIIDIPITATDLKGGTWIMLGQGVFRDGQSLHEAYGCDLDKLVEGDKVGVMRNSRGELLFYVNGDCQGVASCNIPSIVYAVVDMYGKCAQVTLTSPSTPDSNPLDDDSVEELSSARDSNLLDPPANSLLMFQSPPDTFIGTDRLCILPSALASRPPLAPTASEEASLTEAPSSALSNHVANIGIANSLLSAQDSNLLRQGESSDIDEAILGPSEGATSPSFESFNSDNNNNNNNNNNAPSHVSNNNSNNNTGRVATEVQHRRQNDVDNMAASERLRFHERAGILVRLSGNRRTAERKRPLEEFNNGVVMTHRPLKINELFEIRIDRLVDKWSGSIEVGITTHNPNHVEFPATMTSMRSGTIMMSGSAILTNGKGTVKEYGNFNLDELKEGDRIGMMIKEERNLHYFINGQEQGIAASNVPSPVWAVVDLYGMTVKVSIVDRDERDEQNMVTRRNASLNGAQPLPNELDGRNEEGNADILLFHTTCGTYAEVINRGRTAHRPKFVIFLNFFIIYFMDIEITYGAADDFNNGVVLSHRPLRPNEMFEVQLDKLVDKWAGSLEIGVTTHSPTELEFPSTMTNVRSGTWLLTSNGVTHNGTTIAETYGLNIDRLKVGERIGVCRKENGSLHFYVDGVDRGVAATNVPERVYGVVDLYGQAAQATICNPSDRLRTTDIAISSASSSTVYSDLRFHHLHGRNARITRGGLVAQRPNGSGEFNDAIVMSNRPLHDGEIFEVMIEKMVDRWSGSLEAGVTAIAPEQIDFPSTMTDIDYETWMLSGSSVMRNGVTIMNNYPCDLDSLGVGTRIGMMRHSDGTLHYYVNGEDQGAACGNLKSGLWAVIDLYGQCAQVSIVHNPIRLDHSLLSVSQYLDMSRLSLPTGGQPSLGTEVLHRWSKCCGANIALSNNQTMATRLRHFNHGLVFSSHSLEPDELFEVKIEKLNPCYSGSLRIGLTALPITDTYPSGMIPSSISGIDQGDTWWVENSSVRRNGGVMLRRNYCPDLSRLQCGGKVGVKRTTDGTMRLYIDGEDFGSATSNISKHQVFAVVELFGGVESISIISVSRLATPILEGASAPIAVSQDSLELGPLEARNRDNVEMRESTKFLETPLLVENSGAQTVAIATVEALGIPGISEHVSETFFSRPQGYQFHENRGRNIELSSDRTSAARIESYNQGIVLSSKPLSKGMLFQIKGRYGPNLDSLSGGSGGHLIGVLVDAESRLHLYVNGVDQGVAAKEIPSKIYCIIDLYGQCQEEPCIVPLTEKNMIIMKLTLTVDKETITPVKGNIYPKWLATKRRKINPPSTPQVGTNINRTNAQTPTPNMANAPPPTPPGAGNNAGTPAFNLQRLFFAKSKIPLLEGPGGTGPTVHLWLKLLERSFEAEHVIDEAEKIAIACCNVSPLESSSARIVLENCTEVMSARTFADFKKALLDNLAPATSTRYV
ncbi:Neuralized-like protein 4 [Armadillidium nasatum]|uniref:Neuralized-like protein 4 n=1 Tax=Armadillidium nasatum TaxID=96803 RepID=A0A5N5TPK8_9CRUS|nr:Neuralized-like protein 4 [Armadillidium nasatum]